jgi:hypothetical protein
LSSSKHPEVLEDIDLLNAWIASKLNEKYETDAFVMTSCLLEEDVNDLGCQYIALRPLASGYNKTLLKNIMEDIITLGHQRERESPVRYEYFFK